MLMLPNGLVAQSGEHPPCKREVPGQLRAGPPSFHPGDKLVARIDARLAIERPSRSMALFKILSICNGGGYRYCRTDPPHPRANTNGLYPLHRVLAENRLGRLLEPNEHVHHRDGDKTNDRPDNLEVLLASAHAREHRLQVAPQPLTLTCSACGRIFELKPHVFRLRQRRNKTSAAYCSRSCGSRRKFCGLEKRPISSAS